MLKTENWAVRFVILFLWSSVCYSQVGQGGSSGLAFLKVGVGGRATGLGEAFTAVSDDATATYWNPAGLARLPQAQFAFTHTEWIQDMTSEFAAFAFPALHGVFGLSLYSNNISGIERRTGPSDTPLGTIDAHDLAIGLSYGRSISSKLQAGITVKYLYEKIFVESASGYALDVGVTFQPLGKELNLAVTAQNFGSMGTLRQEEIALPQTIRFGASYQLALGSFDSYLLLTADGVKVRELDLRGNFGAELRVRDLLAFRFGYQAGLDERSFGGGVGFVYKRYRFDYGYSPFKSNLGDSHRISFGLDI